MAYSGEAVQPESMESQFGRAADGDHRVRRKKVQQLSQVGLSHDELPSRRSAVRLGGGAGVKWDSVPECRDMAAIVQMLPDNAGRTLGNKAAEFHGGLQRSQKGMQPGP